MSLANVTPIADKDVSHRIAACCAQHIPAIVAQPDSQTAIKAAFSLLGPDSVRFEVRGQPGARFTTLAPAVVSFTENGRVHAFVGTVLGYVPSTGAGYLTMTLPPFILQPDMRRSFRVPLLDANRVQVRLEDQGYAVHEPRLLDLSTGGMLIEFPGGSDPNLGVESPVNVQLQLDDHIAAYLAEVRHARSLKYGLLLVDSSDPAESVKQEAALKNILAELERAWLGDRQ